MILKLFSKIIKTMIMFIIQKFYKLQCLEKYVRGEILYLILKNCTYLSMVFIYAALTYMDKSGTQLEVAIGVLFLLDTFFNQENVIQEKIKS
jgi:ACR3 family arsenite efflux pump ArsB